MVAGSNTVNGTFFPFSDYICQGRISHLLEKYFTFEDKYCLFWINSFPRGKIFSLMDKCCSYEDFFSILGIFRSTPKKNISSGVDNWYLDEFFEKFICGR
jgi:hypothetical protein